MAGEHTLEGENGKIALKMLKNITNILDKKGIKYWLEGGTLLGVIRENRLLPWDNDLDISITEEYYDDILKITSEIKKLGYVVRTREFESGESPFKRGGTRMIKIRNKKLFFFRGEVVLDIFIKYEKDGEYFWQVGQKKKSVPKHFYSELISYKFDGKDYLVPQEYEDYLTHRYGNWKIPVKEWDTFSDDKAVKGDI